MEATSKIHSTQHGVRKIDLLPPGERNFEEIPSLIYDIIESKKQKIKSVEIAELFPRENKTKRKVPVGKKSNRRTNPYHMFTVKKEDDKFVIFQVPNVIINKGRNKEIVIQPFTYEIHHGFEDQINAKNIVTCIENGRKKLFIQPNTYLNFVKRDIGYQRKKMPAFKNELDKKLSQLIETLKNEEEPNEK